MRDRELTPPCTTDTPKFKVVTIGKEQAYAMFNSLDDAYEFDLLFPDVFDRLELEVCPCGCGAVAFALGRLQ